MAMPDAPRRIQRSRARGWTMPDGAVAKRPRLMPAETPDYMAPAWAACMKWAIGEVAILAAFRAETGNLWKPAKSGLERAIDDATVAGEAFVEAFVLWANENVWGPLDGGDDA